jgi:hypothetical protein
MPGSPQTPPSFEEATEDDNEEEISIASDEDTAEVQQARIDLLIPVLRQMNRNQVVNLRELREGLAKGREENEGEMSELKEELTILKTELKNVKTTLRNHQTRICQLIEEQQFLKSSTSKPVVPPTSPSPITKQVSSRRRTSSPIIRRPRLRVNIRPLPCAQTTPPSSNTVSPATSGATSTHTADSTSVDSVDMRHLVMLLTVVGSLLIGLYIGRQQTTN